MLFLYLAGLWEDRQVFKDFIVTDFQAYVHESVMEELKGIIDDSEVTKEDDALWPAPDRVGQQVCAQCNSLSV